MVFSAYEHKNVLAGIGISHKSNGDAEGADQ